MMFFYVSLLKPNIHDDKNRTPPCPARVGGIGVEEEWIVESIIDHRNVDKQSKVPRGVRDPVTGVVPIIRPTTKKYNIESSGLDFLLSLLLGLVLIC
jgi:hypothetical protein